MKDALKVNQLVGCRRTPVAHSAERRVFVGDTQNALINPFSVLLHVHLRAVWHHDDMLRSRYEIRKIDRDKRIVGAALVFHLRRKLANECGQLRTGSLGKLCRER